MKHAMSVVLAILIAGLPAWADSRSFRWSELAGFMENHPVALMLPDGAKIEGRPIGVEPEQLVLEVRKTSNPSAHARGRQSIPRSQVLTVVVNRPTIRWRVIGASVGGVAGIPAGALVAIEKDGLFGGKDRGNGIVAAIIAGLAAAGFLIGWAVDQRKTTVTIIP
jgi:hypothetical protein